jgi:hypothetical protein
MRKVATERRNAWPAFVDTYRTLLADPTPELIRLFERLGEIREAA